MTSVTVERHNPLIGKPYWSATYHNGQRTFVHGYYKTNTEKFETLEELLKWAEAKYRSLDSSPGGGYGVGVTVYLDKMILAEYWDKRTYENGKETGWEKISKTYITKRNW